jgi:hypothetical protein
VLRWILVFFHPGSNKNTKEEDKKICFLTFL